MTQPGRRVHLLHLQGTLPLLGTGPLQCRLHKRTSGTAVDSGPSQCYTVTHHVLATHLQDLQRELQQTKSQRDLTEKEAAELSELNQRLQHDKEELERQGFQPWLPASRVDIYASPQNPCPQAACGTLGMRDCHRKGEALTEPQNHQTSVAPSPSLLANAGSTGHTQSSRFWERACGPAPQLGPAERCRAGGAAAWRQPTRGWPGRPRRCGSGSSSWSRAPSRSSRRTPTCCSRCGCQQLAPFQVCLCKAN
jgi:hypothetical protein